MQRKGPGVACASSEGVSEVGVENGSERGAGRCRFGLDGMTTITEDSAATSAIVKRAWHHKRGQMGPDRGAGSQPPTTHGREH